MTKLNFSNLIFIKLKLNLTNEETKKNEKILKIFIKIVCFSKISISYSIFN